MAIAFDAATDGGHNGGAGNLTFAHTCSGSDRVLFVGFEGNYWNATNYVSGVTYNGVALSSILYVNSGFGGRQMHLYMLLNPDSGTHNVIITISGAQYLIALAASYTGASQAGQPNATDTSVGGSGALTSSVTTTAANCWTMLVESGYPGTTVGSGITERTHGVAFTSIYLYDSAGPVGAAGVYSMTTTRASTSDPSIHMMIAITEGTPPQPVNGTVSNCCNPGEVAGPNPIGSLGWTAACDGGGIVDAVADLDDGEYWG